ncbi:kielin/chordin-like protein isoform X2 [Penaeus monodon]|uniref:kielin/chordin-like protein isoform X2 n=1 Tax=Penaeus monodon TaxID=6687 RepID=UPI0018A7B255|nr:kielin/chordin-like protein isoform X2 [Penaeus monodon]
MKTLCVLLLLGVVVAVVESSALQCREGETIMDDCNTCQCKEGFYVCTLIDCQEECIDGEVIQRDCNTCRCRNGRFECTEKACLPVGAQRGVTLPPHFTCAPGSRWKVECNTCTCSETGLAACTLMACFGGKSLNAQQSSDEPVCDEGSRWKIDDCNWCKCIRGSPACSSRPCDNHQPLARVDTEEDIPPGGVCTRGSAWKPDCNWCTCTRDGNAVCNLKACLDGYVPDPTQKQCENGSKWLVDCNTCVCVDERARCTQKACAISRESSELPPDAVCKPGSMWKEDCNMCRCSSTGKAAACTMRGCAGTTEDASEPKCSHGSKWKRDECNWCDCVHGEFNCTERVCGHPTPHISQPDEEEEMCTEGSRWRVSCNWCTCRNGTGGCTKRGCPPDYDQRTDDPECEANSMWKKDCNWCNCHNGRGICTILACNTPFSAPTVHSQPTVEVTVTRDEAECTEGSRWLRSCNSCRCIEGKAACTKRRCIPDFKPSPEDSVCEGNSSWRVDCNWCNCVNGKAICTIKACGVQRPRPPPVVVTVTREEGATCTEGSRWRLGCNWCRCIKGQGACTKRGCTAGDASAPDDPICEENSSWKVDCNWCNCVDGKAVCTEMGCGPEGRSLGSGDIQENPAPKPCINGTTWSKDCNRCSCINGVGRCTRNFCRHPPVDPICNLPAINPEVEFCRGFESLWTFDSYDGRCVEIIYGGCGGTENLFETKAACEAKCTRTRQGSLRSEGSQEDKCKLDLDSGPCFGLFHRYGYNSANGRCEQFVFGGCGGNANNFETVQECQDQCGGGAPVSDPSCDRTKCPWKRWAHYLVKNCIPQYEDGACCPTSFSCPLSDSVIPDPTKCYYRGIFYEDGENVPVEEVCSASCRCLASSSPAQINCANIECPSLFRPPRPGCRRLYSPDQCCSVDEECQDSAAPPGLETRAAGCSWGNKTYQIGDKMYFDDFPCQSCVCTPEFTSPTGPGCSKVDCGFEFRYTSRLADGCVPIFFEEKCCPIDWMCPGDSRITPPDAQQQQQRVSPQKKDEQCHLGELSISQGSKLNINNCRLDCRCTTPPELTCVQYRSCELAAESTQPKDCPEVNCPPACQTMTDAATGCPVCSCTKYTFSCEKKECPSGCRTDFDSKTGCLTCKCQCPKHPHPCPMDCAVRHVKDETTGCEVCECDPNKPWNPFSPPGHSNCPTYPLGRLPCPLDCEVRIVVDDTGCEKCECDPNNPSRPSDCPTDYSGRAPCPMDCGIHYFTDPETGCEKCECDPADSGHPFGPPPRSNCPKGPSGKPPCPMDCAIRYVTDPETGCEKCECDPANPGHPFGPHIPPPRSDCPVGPSGEPPCPMDCAIRHVTDPETGCVRCECDPNKPGHPFGPHVQSRRTLCPRDHTGKPPCPMDCAIRIVMDEQTGCERCICDPDNPGNPFGPY